MKRKIKKQICAECRRNLKEKAFGPFVYQWRYRTSYGTWKVSPYLMTEERARLIYSFSTEFLIYAGPFEE